MKRAFRLTGLLGVVAAGLLFVNTGTAQAQKFGHKHNHSHHGGHNSHHGGHNSHHGGHGHSHGWNSGPIYHGPSVHYDKVYHPTSTHWTPWQGWHTHGHYDYVPHYVPGHFDYLHGNHIHGNPYYHNH